MVTTFKPSLEEIKKLVASGQGNIIPISTDIAADLVTPVSAYLKVSRHSDYSFLFESVAGGEKLGRFSFVGACTFRVL
jgi:anthranilate synthase component 1